ncbi:MAG: spore maturation protein [Lachnospiraceae bacterium]|nr:spore maturation protein [Lachnospiraceae bacterium]
MEILLYLSDMIIPLLIFVVIVTGLMKKRNVYEDFVEGAKDGMKTVVGILPTLIGLMMGVGILRSSGFLDFLSHKLSVITDLVGFPSELVPLSLVKMFSSSAATGLLLDIFKEFGTDSYIGLIASIMLSCTETIFYTMSVYFIAAKVSKTRWTLKGALISTVAGIIASVFLAGILRDMI